MKSANIIRGIAASFFLLASSYAVQAQKAATNYSFDNLPKAALPEFRYDTFRITDYGAKPSKKKLNTESIQEAIKVCNSKGGGVVFIPDGVWLTGPLEMKSNVNLYLDRKAVLSFTTDFSEYELIKTNWEGVPAVRNQSPIWGKDLVNVAITGHGIIDGNGDAWRPMKKEKVPENVWNEQVASGGLLSDDKKTWYPSEGAVLGSKTKEAGVIEEGKNIEDYKPVKDFLRPNLLVLSNCKKVLLKGVTFQNSPAWTLHLLVCEDLTLSGVAVKNPWYAQNGDGTDIESCRNVVLENSTFAAGDDGICIKSGKDAEGRKRGLPTENVSVHDCIVYRAHGGFVIGSEMSGGARNIVVSDCSFIGTDVGLRFKTKRGRGGLVENIFVRNITMKNIIKQAILFDMYYEAKDPSTVADDGAKKRKDIMPVTEGTPRFRNFYISNVTCNGAERAMLVRGLPEMSIENISLEHIKLVAQKGVQVIEAKNITLRDVVVKTEDTNPVILVTNSSDITFDDMQYSANPVKLFSVTGEKCANINVSHTKMPAYKQAIEFLDGATAQVVNIK